MKIWLDRTPASQVVTSECSDCVDPFSDSTGKAVQDNFLYSEDDSRYVRANTFQQPTSLHKQACSEESWLVCNPLEDGRVAVLDSQAFTLLERFHASATLADVQDETESSPTTIGRVITLFYRLGLLQNMHGLSLPSKDDQPQTLSAWLHVTNACNLRCHYCYLDKTSEHMADDTARRAVNAIIRSATKHGFKHIRLKYAGGEASLHLGRVLAIHDYATELAQQHELGLSAYMVSNGVALTQRVFDEFKLRRIGITISLDGIGASHDSQRQFLHGPGSFKYVDRTISQLLDSGFVPHINVTISQRNLYGLTDLTEYILERGMPFTFNYYRDNDCSSHLQDLKYADTQMIETMHSVFGVIEKRLPKRCLLGSLIDKANLNSLHTHTCGVGQNYLVIDQHGGIAKCHSDIKQTITTVDADDPLQILKSDLQGLQGHSVEDKEGCRSCEWRYWCTGGCPLQTYRVTGRFDVKSPNCNIYKALFPQALRLEAMRLLKYEFPIVL
jgi:uncharacterized protein